MRRLAPTLVLTLLILAGLPAGAAFAAPGCGDTITTNTTLTADIGPCLGTGLFIGADNIVLNLNGHTVSGTVAEGEGAGILLTGRTNVRIQGGTVRAFDAGIHIDGGGSNLVTAMQLLDNIGEGGGPLGDGIAINSSNNTIARSSVIHNGPYGGITVLGGTGNLIQANKVRNNNVPRSDAPIDEDIGIRIEAGSGHVIRNNQVTGNSLDGISIFTIAHDNRVIGNLTELNGYHLEAHRFGSGIIVFGDSNIVRENVSGRNRADGIEVRLNGTGNRLVQNQAARNKEFDLNDLNPSCDANVWSGNTFGTADPVCTTG